MNIVDNYSEYKKEAPKYSDWKKNRDLQEAKRLAYINENKITEKDKHSDIQRAEAILNCINVMDEFSQTRAEDMEVVTEQGKSIITEIGTYTTMGLLFLCSFLSKSFAKNARDLISKGKLKALPKLALPAILSSIPMFASIIVASAWGAGQEIKASRIGRAEAISKKLNSPKQFAELTDEQETQMKEIAKTIKLSPKEIKKKENISRGGVFKSLKLIFSKNKEEYNTINAISNKIKEDKKQFDKVELTKKEIEEAKKDKQLIQTIVEKIDIASQEYAEDAELATSIVSSLGLAGGFLTGYITNKLAKLIPTVAKHSTIASVIVGVGTTLGVAISSAKIQKQASRVGRYRAKEDFLKNPEKLFFIDDKETDNIDGSKYLKENKKPGFFKFIQQLYKENKEYNQYLKTGYVQQQKLMKAREQIDLTPEQEKRAKQLQINTFKMFNKLDEKSQTYSESVEALGEIVSTTIMTILSFALMGIPLLSLKKNTQNINSKEDMLKTFCKIYAPFLSVIAVAIPLNAYITKEQKKASKVANMLAINELEDYRNFADYDNAKNKTKGYL